MPTFAAGSKRVLTQWRDRAADGEPQMVVNRFAAGLLVLSFNEWFMPHGAAAGLPLLLTDLYILLGWLIALHMLLRPGLTTRRRLAALVLDCSAVSYELHIGGAITAWIFAGYLWTIFGNGFRFGARFHGYAMLGATIGFCAMTAFTPYWHSQPALFFGGILTLAVVPLYALTLIERLSQARRQAEEANRAKSLFLASVSHELRTPLNAVIGMGALLESSNLNAEQTQMSQTITASARSLLSLIDGILDLSRIEAGRMVLAESDFDLAQLLCDIKTIFVTQARSKGVRIHLHVTARTPLRLHGDARKLHEILLNLVGNAMKFTESGSITVAADVVAQHDAQLRLRLEVTDTGIGIAPEAQERIFEIFTQADETVSGRFGGTGLGLALVRKTVEFLGGEIGVRSAVGAGSCFWFELPMQRQAVNEALNGYKHLRAFVLMPRLAPGLAVVAPLLGRLSALGLQVEQVEAAEWDAPGATPPVGVLAFERIALDAPPRRFEALRAAEALAFVEIRTGEAGGLLDSAAQSRTSSILYLSATDTELSHVLHFVAAGPAPENLPQPQPARPAETRKLRLLVADDNATNRYVLEMILRSAGHAVRLASNGEEALDALAEEEFDAAVLDVNMPVMDGIEAAKHYRMSALGDTAIPLIALTADASQATAERCLAAGMAVCAVKPVEPARLLALVQEVAGSESGIWPPPAEPPDPRITELAKHPRFKNNVPPPAIDAEVLAGLRNLGGDAFVIDVAEIFRGEARVKLQELQAAAGSGDVIGFRAKAHALRSVAANVGARHLAEICQPFQSVAAVELLQRGAGWLEQIELEMRRVDAALGEYCASRAANGQR
jgi:two-component system, sensor histidine kinase RpfC